MAARLQEIARRVTPDGLFYRNDLWVELLRREETGSPEPLGPGHHFSLSVQLVRAGRPEEALIELDRVIELLRKEGREPTEENWRTFDTQRALYHLRIGEQQNCIHNHSADSCLLPIRGKGVHRYQQGSRAAMAIYRELLEKYPEDLNFRWLLNLAAMTVGEYPGGVDERWRLEPEIFASDYELPRFLNVAVGAGVDHPMLSGGVVMEDLNGDGFLDLMTSSWGVLDQMRYFQSNGDGSFTDRTSEVGLMGLVGGLNLNHADYDNDGRRDVLVMRGGWLDVSGEYPNSLLRNREDGVFEDVTERAGLLSFHPSQAATWGDFDNDGRLDLFIGNESRTSPRKCALYRNNGDGTFTDIAGDVGLDHVGFVKAAAWGDYNNDGLLDLYLSQMFASNILFRSEGPQLGPGHEAGLRARSWRFTDVTAEAGVGEPVKSFPAFFLDYDNDGWLDLMVASFSDFKGFALGSVVADYLGLAGEASRCRLYHNRQDGTFEDVSQEMNVHRVLLAMGANFGDFDNDGFLDMYIGTGEPAMMTLVPNVAFRNDRGRRFQDVTTSGGFGHLQKGHGIAFGDLDNDGDQDIYAVMGGAYSGDFYQNALFENPGFPRHHWLTLELEGVEANRAAIGARVRVEVEDADGSRREIHRVVGTGGSFGSSSLRLETGLGEAKRIVSLDIRWPGSGSRSHFAEVPMDKMVKIREGEETVQIVELPRFRLPSSGGDHTGHARSATPGH